jgi:hypothetical protein
MPNLDREIQSKTEAFVRELTELVKRAALESVARAIGGRQAGSGPASRKGKNGTVRQTRGRRAVAKRKGQKRTPDQLDALTESLYKAIKSGPGRRIEQIGETLGVPTKDLALPAKKLISEKRVKTKGVKRATTYFAK